MKTLSDDIIINVSGFNITTTGLYSYRVYKGTSNIIFAGQIYMQAGDDEVDIDITDILRNYAQKDQKFFGTKSNLGSGLIEYDDLNSINSHVAPVNVQLVFPSSVVSGTSQDVGFFYTNPVKIADYPISTWTMPTTEQGTYPYSEGVQRLGGITTWVNTWRNGKMLISHYPWKSTVNYGVSTMLATGKEDSMDLSYSGRLSRPSVRTIPFTQKRLAKWYISLQSLLDTCTDRGIQYGKEGIITVNGNTTKLCIIDFCAAPYYLKWQDRYGSWNSYGFSGKSTYKETFSKETSSNWKGVTKPISTTVKCSWSLSSGWIPEKDVPHFENIFTSPYLALYDTERDTLHDVIITDNSFEEKTYYNNGRKMISLSFNVELSKQQLIL